LFAVLFGLVSGSFWTATAGFVMVLAGGDRHLVSARRRSDTKLDTMVRTAIVMPICNEDVARVFAGLRATYASLERTGLLQRFDFFVLSDSSDPDARVAEVDAWFAARSDLDAVGRIFYRWRVHRIKRKSGNIADFCRRWGRRYRYMVVLDADSVMSGECLTTLVRLMEAHPEAGIIQTVPRAIGRESLHARVQQFASRVYGPLFVAGLHFWQLGESHYWGHNAIIRVAPFIRHCALRRLPGRGPLAGEILSHDFIEAALMRRAGWAVWMAHDLPGSYEMMPPNLLDELKRDRRWCAGNLMNLRLLFMPGLAPAHRAMLLIGVMAYASGALWLALLVLATALVAANAFQVHHYFVMPHQLAPIWPEWHPEWALQLLGMTAALLFLPKVFGAIAAAVQGTGPYGGGLRLAWGVFAECVLSAVLAPIRMLFHARFVLKAVCGGVVSWRSPSRDDAETTWGEALAGHGTQTLLGIGWAAAVYALDPAFLWWLVPIFGPWIASIPLSVWTSRASLGRAWRDAGCFITPEEHRPPPEVRAAQPPPSACALPQFLDAVVDPRVNALICATSRTRGVRRVRDCGAFSAGGVTADLGEWDRTRRMQLLNDPVALSRLHSSVTIAGGDVRGHPRVSAAPDRMPVRGARTRRLPDRPGQSAAQIA